MATWMKISDYARQHNIDYTPLMALAYAHKKRGYDSRFRRIDGFVHINADYEHEREQETLKLESLYFQVRERFERDHDVGKYFSKIVDKPAATITQYFRGFRFGGTKPSGFALRQMYIKVFEEFLKDKQ